MRTYIHACIHALIHTYIYMHTCIDIYIHTCMHAWMHTHERTHTCTHVHTHRVQYLPPLPWLTGRWWGNTHLLIQYTKNIWSTINTLYCNPFHTTQQLATTEPWSITQLTIKLQTQLWLYTQHSKVSHSPKWLLIKSSNCNLLCT